MKLEQHREIYSYLKEAREAIDGRMNCHTPEYEALDNLERAIEKLFEVVHEGRE